MGSFPPSSSLVSVVWSGQQGGSGVSVVSGMGGIPATVLVFPATVPTLGAGADGGAGPSGPTPPGSVAAIVTTGLPVVTCVGTDLAREKTVVSSPATALVDGAGTEHLSLSTLSQEEVPVREEWVPVTSSSICACYCLYPCEVGWEALEGIAFKSTRYASTEGRTCCGFFGFSAC